MRAALSEELCTQYIASNLHCVKVNGWRYGGGSTDEIRQLNKGRLGEERDVHNVQVVVNEATMTNVTLSLMDADCVFLEVKLFQSESTESDDVLQQLAEAKQIRVELKMELDQTRELLDKEWVRIAQLTEELSSATGCGVKMYKLKAAQDKLKQVCHLNCTQSREQQEPPKMKVYILEIGRLKAASQENLHSVSPEGGELIDTLVQPSRTRKRKASPVESFTGEK